MLIIIAGSPELEDHHDVITGLDKQRIEKKATSLTICYRTAHLRQPVATCMGQPASNLRRTNERGKEKLKRRPPGTGGRGEGSSGLGDLEARPPSAPAHGVFWQRPNFVVADETQSNPESTAPSKAKSILRAVRESSNAYPPLGSIAEALYVILDNHEV